MRQVKLERAVRFSLSLGILSCLLITAAAHAQPALPDLEIIPVKNSGPEQGAARQRVVDLKPHPDSEVLFQEFSARILEDGKVSFRGTVERRAGDPAIAIGYEVDLEAETYTTRRLDPAPYAQRFSDRRGLTLRTQDDSTQVRSKAQQNANYVVYTYLYDAVAEVHTKDPPQFFDPTLGSLTTTTTVLGWHETFYCDPYSFCDCYAYPLFLSPLCGWSEVYADFSGYSCWAANPSFLDTHWFVEDCDHLGAFYLGFNTWCTQSAGSYKNSDFLLDWLDTLAEDSAAICGVEAGLFSVLWEWEASGEAWFLLGGVLFAF